MTIGYERRVLGRQRREEPGAQDVFSPTISSTAARKKEEFAAVEWKRKSCVTACELVLSLHLFSGARKIILLYGIDASIFF